MEKRILRNTDEQVSLLGFGCMRLPKLVEDKQDIDYDKALPMIDYAYKHGVNYFDTAYPYHEGASELFIGEALKNYPRDSFNLASKLPMWLIHSAADVRKYCEEQLAKCQVEYFDYYLAHGLNKDRLKTIADHNVIEELKKLKAEGKIRHIGFSFHDTPDVLEEILKLTDWEFCQIQLNYFDWDLQDAKRQYELIEERGIQCIIMEPVRGGALATLSEEAAVVFKNADPAASVASWAVRYAASKPNVLTVLSGMTAMEHVVDNVATMTDFKPLDAAGQAVIDEAVAAYRKAVTIPCTACRYCMDCPSGVDIPGVFAAYNSYAITKSKNMFMTPYTALGESAQAHNCVECRICVDKCPQHIDIPEQLKLARALAE